jgi:histidinol-phosphate aminotransferase
MEDLDLYDSTEDDDLLVELGKQLNVDKKNLFLHNGSAESIKSIFSVMLNPGDNVLLPNPGWSYYSGIVGYKFGNIIHYDIIEGEEKCIHNMNDIMEKAKKYSPKIIVITSPAMPTGNAIDAHDLEMVVKSNPGSLILVDEAYHGFAPYEIDIRRWIETYDNVVFSRTFSKFYGLANLRIGYGICSESAMHALWLDLPLHRLPHISKRIAIAALHDKEYYETILHETVEVREWFRRELNKLPNILCFKTDSNFVYIRCSGYNLSRVKEYMEENGYLIRIFEGHGEQHLRITVAPREIMEDCFNKLREGLEKNRILLTTTLTLNAMKERQLECEEV